MEPNPIILIIAALLIFALIGGLILRYRRNRFRDIQTEQFNPDVKMSRVWSEWMEADLEESQHKLRAEARRVLAPHQRQAIYDDLIEFEGKVISGQSQLTRIRKEIMASVDRRMINVEILTLPADDKRALRQSQPDVIQTDAHAREYILANELRMALLREYGAQRYGDRADNDWLHVYEKAAQYKRRLTKARILQGLAAEEESEQDSRQQAIDVVDKQLQMRLLQVPPGTSFERDEDS